MQRRGTSPASRRGCAAVPSTPMQFENVNHTHSKRREKPALPQDLPVPMGFEICEARLTLPVPKAPYNTHRCDGLGLPAH